MCNIQIVSTGLNYCSEAKVLENSSDLFQVMFVSIENYCSMTIHLKISVFMKMSTPLTLSPVLHVNFVELCVAFHYRCTLSLLCH